MAAPQQTHNLQGEYLYQYPDHYLFILNNKVYMKAGKKHWPKAVKTDFLSSRGISVNDSIYKKYAKDANRRLIVYDKYRNQYMELTEVRRAQNHLGVETYKNTKLVVLPEDTFTKLPSYENDSVVQNKLL